MLRIQSLFAKLVSLAPYKVSKSTQSGILKVSYFTRPSQWAIAN